MMQVTPIADERIRAKARDLMDIATLGAENPGTLRLLSKGFNELSLLADDNRKYKAACVCKALSTIFTRMPDGNPEDLPFILNIAMNFLDSLLGVPRGSQEFSL